MGGEAVAGDDEGELGDGVLGEEGVDEGDSRGEDAVQARGLEVCFGHFA